MDYAPNPMHYSEDYCQNNPVALETVFYCNVYDYSFRMI